MGGNQLLAEADVRIEYGGYGEVQLDVNDSLVEKEISGENDDEGEGQMDAIDLAASIIRKWHKWALIPEQWKASILNGQLMTSGKMND